MNGSPNFGKGNHQTNRYQDPYQANISSALNRASANILPLSSYPQFYRINSQHDYEQPYYEASAAPRDSSSNMPLAYQLYNNQISFNEPRYHRNESYRSFNAINDTNVYENTNYEYDSNINPLGNIYHGNDSGNSQNIRDTIGVQRSLPLASAEGFSSHLDSSANPIEHNVSIMNSEVAKSEMKLVPDSFSNDGANNNPGNGTRPKDLNLEKRFNNKKQLYKDQNRKEHEKAAHIPLKKSSNHHQNNRQSDYEQCTTNDPSQTKISNNGNNYNSKDFGRARGRGRFSNSSSYAKKSDMKNNSYNHHGSYQNSDYEKYPSPSYKQSNLPERGRYNSRHKSFHSHYYGQSNNYNDYDNSYDRGYNNTRDNPRANFQAKNDGQNNENYYKFDKYKTAKESKSTFNRKTDHQRAHPTQKNSDKYNLGSNQEKSKVDEKPMSNSNGILSSDQKLFENSKAIAASQNSAMLIGRTQRETLIDLLTQGTFECMVCCERIRQQHAIWSCSKCFNCFHLGCIKKWAGTSQGDPGWRCPACQNLNAKVPSGYFCFCKKMREPEWNRRETPHSCGEVCASKRENKWCTHKCTNLCHPGPCPDCSAFVKRSCRCGKNTKDMRCSLSDPFLCGEKCMKPLNCEIHFCNLICHIGPCETCAETITKSCYCGKEFQTMPCTGQAENELLFSCNSICKKMLSCDHHTCKKNCHEGPCDCCDRAVDIVQTCPCGKIKLKVFYQENGSSPRNSCTDAIPTCSKICDKVLKCGTPGSYHRCQSLCHEGQCPPCQNQTVVKCRCGFMDKNIPCIELQTKADEVMCEKQCKKWRQCGRHKCGVKCCIDIDHICERVCGRALKCRLHKCQESCHRGNCPRCWETSFEELSCHCGASVIYPPVPCGTVPPACNLSCRREHTCSHAVSHNCHADAKCPPCTTLVSKPCYGNHTVMKSTPCYVNAMSCGDQCGKMLTCKIHKCQKVCHDGSCIKGEKCNQNCTERRDSCEHACNNKCHSGPCPHSPCKEIVSVMCICGNRKIEMVCSDNDKEYKSLATSKLASMMHNMNNGGSVDLSTIFSGSNKAEKYQRLECNEECGLLARNRRLALALQITNPDSRALLGENSIFPESMKDEARKDMQFAKLVHNSLNDLVLKAKESKQKNRSHSFAPMNRDKRRFIHEYAKFFACQSQSYDEEPKKNVVVTACKQMSRLPPVSIVAVIMKEQGQRKVPGPVLSRKNPISDETSNTMKKLEKSSSFEKKEVPVKVECNDTSAAASNRKSAAIDYFDYT